jgi:hypothetical protein
MQREGVTPSRVHSSLFTSQDKQQTQEKASLGQERTRPFEDQSREDRGAGREGVPEVVAERQGQNATNGRGQRTHPPPCSLSPLPADPAPPPAHDRRSYLRRCAQRPQLSPSETLCRRCARKAPDSFLSKHSAAGVRAMPPALSLRNSPPPTCAQRPQLLSVLSTLLPMWARARGGGWGTQPEVVDSSINLNGHRRRNGRTFFNANRKKIEGTY